MARLPRDTRIALIATAVLLLALAVLAFIGYDRWQAPEIPHLTTKPEGY